MDVTSELILFTQLAGYLYNQFHGVVGAANDTAAEEETLNVVSFVKVQCELNHLVRCEPCPDDVAGATIDAVVAIVKAGVGHQHFEQRDAASVWCVGVADA